MRCSTESAHDMKREHKQLLTMRVIQAAYIRCITFTEMCLEAPLSKETKKTAHLMKNRPD